MTAPRSGSLRVSLPAALLPLLALLAVLVGCAPDSALPESSPLPMTSTADPVEEPVARATSPRPAPATSSPVEVPAAAPSAPERPSRPVVRATVPAPAPAASTAPVVAPAPPVVEQPAPVVVETPAPVVEPAPVVVEQPEEPTCPEGQEWQGEFGCVQPQLPEESDGRQQDCLGEDGTPTGVVGVVRDGVLTGC